jgi:hypothetical protein
MAVDSRHERYEPPNIEQREVIASPLILTVAVSQISPNP